MDFKLEQQRSGVRWRGHFAGRLVEDACRISCTVLAQKLRFSVVYSLGSTRRQRQRHMSSNAPCADNPLCIATLSAVPTEISHGGSGTCDSSSGTVVIRGAQFPEELLGGGVEGDG